MSTVKKASGLLLLLGAGTILAFALKNPADPEDPAVINDDPGPSGGQGYVWPDGTRHAIPYDPARDLPNSHAPALPAQAYQPGTTVSPNQTQPTYVPVLQVVPTVSISQPQSQPANYFNPGSVPNGSVPNGSVPYTSTPNVTIPNVSVPSVTIPYGSFPITSNVNTANTASYTNNGMVAMAGLTFYN